VSDGRRGIKAGSDGLFTDLYEVLSGGRFGPTSEFHSESR
jgi:hypothetical protein